jgi:ketosteroid isomerase-like protein
MKKSTLLLAFFVIVLTACQQQTETKSVDLKAEEAAINDLLNTMIGAFKAQDVPTLQSLLTEDVLCLGSDPSEVWNKKEITEMWTQMLAQPVEIDTIGTPKIQVASDGHSAFAMQQYFMPAFSSKLAFRNGYHLIKSGEKWLIFTTNTACIPKNEDLSKIDKVLSE